jgi:hypothetical protein
MFRAFSRPLSGARWLQWQPLVLPSYRGDSRAVFVVGPRTSSALWVLRLNTCPVLSLIMMCPVTVQDATVTWCVLSLYRTLQSHDVSCHCTGRFSHMMCPVTVQDATVTWCVLSLYRTLQSHDPVNNLFTVQAVSVQFDCCCDSRPLQTLHEVQWIRYSRLGNCGIVWGLCGPGWTVRWSNPGWGRDFPHLSRPALGPTQPPVHWVSGLSRGYRAAGAWRWPLTPF